MTILRKTVCTSTFFVILASIIPILINGLPVEHKENEQKTMYKAVIHKCPQLAEIDLFENLRDIFVTSCFSWEVINATTSLEKDGRTNAQCLILYESLISFCTSFGKDIKHKGLIPTESSLTFSIDQVCSSDTGILSLKNPEHNISNILQPTKCILMCGDMQEKGPAVVQPMCKFSFYFATFNITKFKDHLNLVHNANGGLQGVVKSPAQNSSHVQPVNASKQEVHKEGFHNEVMAVQKPNIIESDQKNKTEQPIKNAEAQGHIPIPPVLEMQNKGPALPHKDIGNPKIDNAPGPDKKQESEVEAPPHPVNDNEDNADLDNGPISNGGEKDFANDDDDLDEPQDKVKAVMPEEKTEQKSPLNPKPPSTIEDDAINSYNTPDDEMDGDSYFFSYFIVVMCLVVTGYVGYHNRQKILALVLEGKRGRRNGRLGKRPNSANYHKLDSNLEEAISSSCTKDASNIIY